MHARLVVTWILVSIAGAAAVTSGREPALQWLVAATALWGALSAAGARSALLLGGARAGAAKLDDTAAPHRLWRGGALALFAGALVGCAVGAAAVVVTRPASVVGWSALLTATSVAGFVVGAALAARALARPRARRTTTLPSWIVLDTALPVGVLAALTGVIVAALRFGGVERLSGVEASRHVAVSLLLYGGLLGLGGGLKTAREKLSGLVVAPSPSREPPGALASGAALGIVVLLVGPRVIDAVETSTLVISKGVLGVVVGTALCALGALRGARR